MPGGRGKSKLYKGWEFEQVCCFRRPAMVSDWMLAPPDDGCAEITGHRRVGPDAEGRRCVWFTVVVYFDRYYKDSMIKRYDPNDYETFAADLGRLPLIITMDLLYEQGFRIE